MKFTDEECNEQRNQAPIGGFSAFGLHRRGSGLLFSMRVAESPTYSNIVPHCSGTQAETSLGPMTDCVLLLHHKPRWISVGGVRSRAQMIPDASDGSRCSLRVRYRE
jgi:hypothetical protein